MKNRILVAPAVVLLASSLGMGLGSGCSEEPAATPGGGGRGGGAVGPQDGGAGAAGGDGGTTAPRCNELTMDGVPVVQRAVVEGPPPHTPGGGTIATGRYYFGSSTIYRSGSCVVYSSDDTTVARGVYEFSATSPTAGTAESLVINGVGEESRVSATYTTTGTSITFQLMCRSVGSGLQRYSAGQSTGVASYTATGGEFREYHNVNSGADAGAAAAGIKPCPDIGVLTKL